MQIRVSDPPRLCRQPGRHADVDRDAAKPGDFRRAGGGRDHSINWGTVVLLAATLPMSTALQVTGGADLIANTLVFAPGGYRFGDYAKVGLPLLLLALVVSVVLAPLIWPLH